MYINISFDHHNVHARLNSGLRIMVEIQNPTDDWNDGILVNAHRDYRDYPLHANNLLGERGIVVAKCCVVKRTLSNPKIIIFPVVFSL